MHEYKSSFPLVFFFLPLLFPSMMNTIHTIFYAKCCVKSKLEIVVLRWILCYMGSFHKSPRNVSPQNLTIDSSSSFRFPVGFSSIKSVYQKYSGTTNRVELLHYSKAGCLYWFKDFWTQAGRNLLHICWNRVQTSDMRPDSLLMSQLLLSYFVNIFPSQKLDFGLKLFLK